ncbi:urease accessory protein UreD [Noviherbaspirillum aridicola]|uniref:Urease accessory protein UreD n=1 Tax=Noviherbaspirillum aridicola TaxID=2849687 RepID=A0ABQ4Q0I5_9BURK|nr:urease accessory protein UreD [Noviherbaspirillum aridicola]GIZ50608.1 urease accessory protein UreD [Noviherbaspirillum aridicola]
MRVHEPWQASLSLGFENDGGVTRLVERRHAGPLRVQKPLYPEGTVLCHAILVHPPGGVVGGDELRIEARVGAGASAFLTTPGAAKWYKANGRVSSQRVQLHAGTGSSLEWMPQETIFFDAAAVDLDTRIDLSGDAVYIGGEILCFGRTASGESFNAGRIAQRTAIRRNGRLIWFEQGAIDAGGGAMRSALGLHGNTVCATFIAAGRPLPADGIAALRECGAGMNAGVSQLRAVVVARLLCDSSESARRWMTRAWQVTRPALTGREAVVPRIWNT